MTQRDTRFYTTGYEPKTAHVVSGNSVAILSKLLEQANARAVRAHRKQKRSPKIPLEVIIIVSGTSGCQVTASRSFGIGSSTVSCKPNRKPYRARLNCLQLMNPTAIVVPRDYCSRFQRGLEVSIAIWFVGAACVQSGRSVLSILSRSISGCANDSAQSSEHSRATYQEGHFYTLCCRFLSSILCLSKALWARISSVRVCFNLDPDKDACETNTLVVSLLEKYHAKLLQHRGPLMASEGCNDHA